MPVIGREEDAGVMVEAESRGEKVAELRDPTTCRSVEQQGMRYAVRAGEEQAIARRRDQAACRNFALVIERHRVHVLKVRALEFAGSPGNRDYVERCSVPHHRRPRETFQKTYVRDLAG